MKRRMITFVLTVALIIVSAVPAFAVTSINDYEQQILVVINDGIEIGEKGDKDSGVLDISRYYNQAYNFFLDNDKLNSQEQVDEILKDIEEAAAYAFDNGIVVSKADSTSFDTSGATAKGTDISGHIMETWIKPIAEKYDITATYDSVTDVLTLKWTGGELNSEDLIKQTGSESMIPPIVVGAALVLVVAVAGVFVYSKSRKIKD